MSDKKLALVLPDLTEFGIKNETLGYSIWNELNNLTDDFDLVRAHFARFSDGSFKHELDASVRNKQVYIFISPELSASDQVMETALILEACRRANADRHGINLMETYNPWYAQDKRDVGHREPNSGRSVSGFYKDQGLSHLFYFEPHCQEALEAWYESVDPIYMSPFHAKHIAEEYELQNCVAASPDDSVDRVKHFSKALGIPLIKVGKIRKHEEKEKAKALGILEDLSGKTVFIYDDMIRTGGTIECAAQSAKAAGAERIIPVATHLILNKPELLFGSPHIYAVRGANTVSRHPTHEKLREYDIANFAAQIAYRKSHGMDVSDFIQSQSPTYKK